MNNIFLGIICAQLLPHIPHCLKVLWGLREVAKIKGDREIGSNVILPNGLFPMNFTKM